MATSVTVDSSTPIVEISAPQQFAATSPVAQTLNYTVTNTTASAVTFAIEGTNADKFSLGTKTDNTIVVSAKGDNASTAAYTANLVAKVAGATVATVALKQAAPASGDDTKGTYTSMAGMIPTADNSANAIYTAEITVPGSSVVAGMKFGTGSKAGVFTTGALGVTGNKKLSFYAVAWKSKSAKLYVRVDNGGSVSPVSVDLRGDDGATGNPPFKTIAWSDETDYFTLELSDLTASSTLTFSTSSTFTAASDSSTGRAVVCGVQIY